MQITSAKFLRGVKGTNSILDDNKPQIAFIGRSNSGKSSLINSLTGVKDLAISSNTPGRTKEINIFLINTTHHFMDLPGYGYAKVKGKSLEKLGELIFWYIFNSGYNPKVVLLIDAEIGPTKDDLSVLVELQKAGREIVVVLNKSDKIRKSHYLNQVKKLSKIFVGHKVFPYSSKTKVGIQELTDELLTKVK